MEKCWKWSKLYKKIRSERRSLIILIVIQRFLLIPSNQLSFSLSPSLVPRENAVDKWNSIRQTACHRDGVGRGNSWLATERRGASECLANSFDTDASIPHPDRMPFSTTAGWSDSIKTASRRVSPVSVRNYCWIICMDPARLHTWMANIVTRNACVLVNGKCLGETALKWRPKPGERQRFQVFNSFYLFIYLSYFYIPFSVPLFIFPEGEKYECVYIYILGATLIVFPLINQRRSRNKI